MDRIIDTILKKPDPRREGSQFAELGYDSMKTP